MTRSPAHLDHVTPYDRFAWTDVEAEQMLASGEHRHELIGFFGEEEYRELARLARQASRTPQADSPRVFIVPGIMGSLLGLPRRAPHPNDVLWIDPIDIGTGRLDALRLPGSAGLVSLGVVLYSYLKLKLHLRAAGFSAVFHHYDWRLGVDELGRAFAERLRNEPSARVAIVAHSMGGLVSRAALALPGTGKVERLVLLGTPNFGSFAAVQALRGTYAVVRKLARLAPPDASAESLVVDVFSTFPSLYHLLPAPACNGGLDLFDPAEWPKSEPRPRAELLQRARNVREHLAPPDHRFSVITGVNQETVTAVECRRDEFVYTITRRGDGTVPAACATLPGADNYYASVPHSELTRDRTVAHAVIDLLRNGFTRRLPREWNYAGTAQAQISDRELRRTHTAKVEWAHLQPVERRIFLQTLNDPPRLRLRVPRAARSCRRQRV